jgi:alpha-tubulin suppressor-like RCC1 family protein
MGAKWSVLLALALLGGACDSPSDGDEPQPTTIEASTTVPASAQVGTAIPVSVLVKDQDGDPMAGVTVTWSVTGGGTVTPATSQTDASGIASASWTLSAAPGGNSLTASFATGHSITFNVTVTPGGGSLQPATIEAASTVPASAPSGSTFPVSVRVKDQNGAPLPGVTVSWLAAGGGVVTPPNSQTNASGIASTSWTISGPAGPHSLTASFAAGHSTTFNVTATAVLSGVVITPDSIRLNSLQDTLTFGVTARDAAGNPLAVTWLSLDPSIATVSATGQVRSLANGRARIVASAVTLADTAIVNVQQVARTVTASRDSLTLELGQAVQVNTAVHDSLGHPILAPTISWTTSNSSVATVSSTGLVTATGGGSARVVVTSGARADTVPVRVAAPIRFFKVSAGNRRTCAVATDGKVSCWGYRLSTTPVRIESGSAVFDTVAAGEEHQCALTAAGAAYCSGDNLYGELGNGTNGSSASFVPVTGGLTFTALAAGRHHTCGLTSSGAVYCWGYNSAGQLGTGGDPRCNVTSNFKCSALPIAVAGGLTFTSIDAFGDLTCALTGAGDPYCWGNNQWAVPTEVSALNYSQYAVGFTQRCGISGGSTLCNDVAVPTSPSFVRVDLGYGFACGLTASGDVLCWGANDDGQLGNGTQFGSNPTPAEVSGNRTFTAVSAGQSHACAVAADGVYCWGGNIDGAVGDPLGRTAVLVPTKVVGQP